MSDIARVRLNTATGCCQKAATPVAALTRQRSQQQQQQRERVSVCVCERESSFLQQLQRRRRRWHEFLKAFENESLIHVKPKSKTKP